MKTKTLLLALGWGAARLVADTLPTDAAVFVQPDPTSFVLAKLKAGSTIVPVGDAPVGWRRVEVSGPFEAFVLSRDINKGLEVREGASVYTAPQKTAPVLTVAGPGDKSEMTGLYKNDSNWVEVKIEKKIQGFVAVGENANTPVNPPPLPPSTPAPPVAPNATAGHPVPVSANTANLPRLFAGRLVSARRPILNPNPIYDYQLTDSTGRRFAYVDTKRLVLTDKIEAFLNLEVTITGTIRNTVDGKDLVIAAESMKIN